MFAHEFDAAVLPTSESTERHKVHYDSVSA